MTGKARNRVNKMLGKQSYRQMTAIKPIECEVIWILPRQRNATLCENANKKPADREDERERERETESNPWQFVAQYGIQNQKKCLVWLFSSWIFTVAPSIRLLFYVLFTHFALFVFWFRFHFVRLECTYIHKYIHFPTTINRHSSLHHHLNFTFQRCEWFHCLQNIAIALILCTLFLYSQMFFLHLDLVYLNLYLLLQVIRIPFRVYHLKRHREEKCATSAALTFCPHCACVSFTKTTREETSLFHSGELSEQKRANVLLCKCKINLSFTQPDSIVIVVTVETVFSRVQFSLCTNSNRIASA